MMEARRWSRAITFWTLLAGVAVTVLATAAGNLAPALLPPGPRDALGLVGLGLFLAAHVAAVCIGLRRAPPSPATRLRLVERGA